MAITVQVRTVDITKIIRVDRKDGLLMFVLNYCLKKTTRALCEAECIQKVKDLFYVW